MFLMKDVCNNGSETTHDLNVTLEWFTTVIDILLCRGDLTKEKEATTSLDGGDAYHGDAIEVHACGRCTMEH